MAMFKAPLTLTRYKESVLRQKMSFVYALLRWVGIWLTKVQDMDAEAALDALADAKRARRAAYAVEKAIEEIAIASLLHEDKTWHIGDDYTAVLRPAQSSRKWRTEALMNALIDTTCHDVQQKHPSLPSSLLQAIVRDAMWRLHGAGRIEWRVTAIRDAGLDPDRFSAKDPGMPSVHIDLRGEGSYPRIATRPRGI